MTDSRLKAAENQPAKKMGRLGSAKLNNLLKKADLLRKRQQYDQAITALNEATDLNPSLEVIFVMRAEIYRQIGKDQLALYDFNQAILLDPGNAGLYILRGELYRLLRQPQEALADLNRALLLKPDEPQALGERGTIYRNTGQFNLALADFNSALEFDPRNTWLIGNRAETYRHLGEYRKALADYSEILTISPEQNWVYERRSYANLRLGYLEKAQQDFEQNFSKNPQNVLAGWMAEWVKMCKRYFTFTPEVADTLRKLAAMSPDNYEGALCRSSLAWLQGDYLPAFQEAEIATKLETGRPEAFFWKGMAEASLNEDGEAFVSIQKALDLKLPPILLGPANLLKAQKPSFYRVYEARFLRKTGPLIFPGTPMEPAEPFSFNEEWTVPNKPQSSAADLDPATNETGEEAGSQVEGLIEENEEIPYLEVLPQEVAEQEAGIEAEYVELVGEETTSDFTGGIVGVGGTEQEAAKIVSANFKEIAEPATEATWEWEIPAPFGAKDTAPAKFVEAEPISSEPAQESGFSSPGVDELTETPAAEPVEEPEIPTAKPVEQPETLVAESAVYIEEPETATPANDETFQPQPIGEFVNDEEAATQIKAETEKAEPFTLEEYPVVDEPTFPNESLEAVETSTFAESSETAKPAFVEPDQNEAVPNNELPTPALASPGEAEPAVTNEVSATEVASQFEATQPIEEVVTPKFFYDEWARAGEDENLVSDFPFNTLPEENNKVDEEGATFVQSDSDEGIEINPPLDEVETHPSKNDGEAATLFQPEGEVEENSPANEETAGGNSPVEETTYNEEFAQPVENLEATSGVESTAPLNSTVDEPETSEVLETSEENDATSHLPIQPLETAQHAGDAPTERFFYTSRPTNFVNTNKPLTETMGRKVDSAEIAPYGASEPVSSAAPTLPTFENVISTEEAATPVETGSANTVETTPVEGAGEITPEFDTEATQQFRLSDLRRDAVEDQEFKPFTLGQHPAETEQEIAPFSLPKANVEPDPEFAPFDLASLGQKANSTAPEIDAEDEIAPAQENAESVTQPFSIFDGGRTQDFEGVQPELPEFPSTATQEDIGEAATQQFEVQQPLAAAFTGAETGPEAAFAAKYATPSEKNVPAEPDFAHPVDTGEKEGDEKTLPAFVIPAAEIAPYTRPAETFHQQVAVQEAATQPFTFVPTTPPPAAPQVVDASTVQFKPALTTQTSPALFNGVGTPTRPTSPAVSATSYSNVANVPPPPPKAPAAAGGWNMRNFAIPLIVVAVILVAVIGYLLLGPKGQGTPTPQVAIQATQGQTPVQATAVATVVLGAQDTTATSTTVPATTAAVTVAPATTAAATVVPATVAPVPTTAAATATVVVPTATAVPPTAAPTTAPATTAAPTATTAPTVNALTADVLKKFTNQNLSGHFSSVYSVAFSPDGKTLASGSNDRSIKIWQINGTSSPAQPLVTLNGHQDAIYSVAFSPDGKLVASGSADRTVKIWQINGANSPKTPVFTLTGHDGGVNLVAFSPDGKTLASASEDKTIKLWDVTTGKLVKTLEGHTFLVNSVAFSPDGKTLVSGSNDKTLRLWDVASGKTTAVLSGHDNFVNSVAFSPDGKMVASGSSDRSIKLWDVTSGKVITTITGHPTGVTFVTFSPDGKTLASGGTDSSIKVWDVSNAAQSVPQLNTLDSGSVGVFSLTFNSNGQVLAEADRSTNIKLWDFGANIFNRK